MVPSPAFSLAGREVPRIGYGAMQLTHPQQPDRDAARRLLHEVVDSGIRHLDTAEFYDGVNATIRDALHPYADGLVLATKVGAAVGEHGLAPAQKPAELRAQVEANLRSLGAERLDLVYLRRADQQPGIVATGDQAVPLDDQLAALATMRDEGLVAAIGLSAVSLAHLRQALPIGIAAVQNAYNLAARGGEAMLELAAEHGVAWVPFFPLGSSWDARPDAPEAFRRLQAVTAVPEVRAAADRLGATASQIALAWLLQHRDNVLLIPGTRSSRHLAENLAAATLDLPSDVVAALDAVGAPAAM